VDPCLYPLELFVENEHFFDVMDLGTKIRYKVQNLGAVPRTLDGEVVGVAVR
jgi:hypothetical protein